MTDDVNEWRIWVDVVAADLGLTCPPGRAGSPRMATRRIDALRFEIRDLRARLAERDATLAAVMAKVRRISEEQATMAFLLPLLEDATPPTGTGLDEVLDEAVEDRRRNKDAFNDDPDATPPTGGRWVKARGGDAIGEVLSACERGVLVRWPATPGGEYVKPSWVKPEDILVALDANQPTGGLWVSDEELRELVERGVREGDGGLDGEPWLNDEFVAAAVGRVLADVNDDNTGGGDADR